MVATAPVAFIGLLGTAIRVYVQGRSSLNLELANFELETIFRGLESEVPTERLRYLRLIT